MKELTLQQLASWCGGKVAPEYEAIKVNGIQSDSRKVQPGELFLALRGERVDGHDYIPAAKGKGAVAALVSQESGELPCIVVENTLRAYGEIARHLAGTAGLSRMSAQAVGGAVGHNEISIIIPCHRVVGTSGSLTGYAGGIERKVKLLELERADMTHLFAPKKGTAL